ncbi:MAG: hypothetical protein M1832_002778 [Thelocarpon impressellum]|nr:MAG: hypothetical protein M1832_002778 [Thelocarpon impressellum]
MSASPPSTASPNPRKRASPHDGDEVPGTAEVAQLEGSVTHVNDPGTLPTPPKLVESMDIDLSHNSSRASSRLSSPAPSTNASIGGLQPNVSSSATATPSAKRRKLTLPEKEEKRRQKELADRQKVEQRAVREEAKRQKEIERRQKEEEKRKKDEEREEERKKKDDEKRRKEEEKEVERRRREQGREEKRNAKEEEKRAKDEEKRLREEQKTKKERSQMRLNAFLVKPSGSPSKASDAPAEITSGGIGADASRHLVFKPVATEDSPASPDSSPSSKTDYERAFPPFFVQTHVAVAPQNRFSKADDALQATRDRIDQYLKREASTEETHEHACETFDIKRLHAPSNTWNRSNRPRHSVKQLIAQLHGSPSNPVDLTDAASQPRSEDLLAGVPVKFLQFAEDVRPPYRGTYSKLPHEKSSLGRGRNPFQRALPNTNYDYDSEAEWEEPEDGEDLDSEGEEDAGSEEEGDEMDGFLDDEDMPEGPAGAGNRRRVTGGDMEPVSSGMCWELAHGRPLQHSKVEGSPTASLGQYRLEVISEAVRMPIDPFSASYWQKPTELSQADNGTKTGLSEMNPPRLPLLAVNRCNATVNGPLATLAWGGKASGGLLPVPAPTALGSKRTIRAEDMADFRDAVQGSDLTKTGLIEVLKKR